MLVRGVGETEQGFRTCLVDLGEGILMGRNPLGCVRYQWQQDKLKGCICWRIG